MSDEPVTHIGGLKLATETIALSRDPIPVLYFEDAPSLSHTQGVIGVTLTVMANVPDGDGSVKQIASIAGILKCSIPAAMALRAAIDSALLLAVPTQNPEGKPS